MLGWVSTSELRVPPTVPRPCHYAFAVRRVRDRAMSDNPAPNIGRSLLRREDRRPLTGEGQIVADIVLPPLAHAGILRRPPPPAPIPAGGLSRAPAAPRRVAAP